MRSILLLILVLLTAPPAMARGVGMVGGAAGNVAAVAIAGLVTGAVTGAAALAMAETGKGCAMDQLRGWAACPPEQAIDWRNLGRLSVVFGHQSVGNNLLSGVERLAAWEKARIAIREQRQGPALAGINHFLIGRNGDPAAKIRDFAAAIDAGAAQGADVAMMKLCYADFNATTDARQVAEQYISSLESLSRRYPDTRFVAVTVPLRAVQTGAKAWGKRLLGQLPGGYLDNARRGEFNTRLRERYLATGRLFDLARAESDASGECCRVSVDGQEVETLNPELTQDGGHLNERGQVLVGSAFLSFASALAARQVTK